MKVADVLTIIRAGGSNTISHVPSTDIIAKIWGKREKFNPLKKGGLGSSWWKSAGKAGKKSPWWT